MVSFFPLSPLPDYFWLGALDSDDSFSFDHWIGGGNVVFFHLTNALIHISCLIAVMFLVFNLLQAVGERETSAERISAPMFVVLVAGVWALNPVQTNAVTYLVQRMASLQAFFYIIAISFYILGRRKHFQSLA